MTLQVRFFERFSEIPEKGFDLGRRTVIITLVTQSRLTDDGRGGLLNSNLAPADGIGRRLVRLSRFSRSDPSESFHKGSAYTRE